MTLKILSLFAPICPYIISLFKQSVNAFASSPFFPIAHKKLSTYLAYLLFTFRHKIQGAQIRFITTLISL
jgi:hypothetical protein